MQEQDPSDDRHDAVDRLMAENDRLRAILLGKDPVVCRLTYTPEDGVEVELEHWAVRLLAVNLAESLFAGRKPSEANYLILKVSHPDYGPIEVTLRKGWGGKSPSDHIGELEQENGRLREQVVQLRDAGGSVAYHLEEQTQDNVPMNVGYWQMLLDRMKAAGFEPKS